VSLPVGVLAERHLDVREDIERGAEPFQRILAAVGELGPDEALVLHVPFEPLPLYKVLGARGFAHHAERRAPGDWWIWFYRPAPASTSAPQATPAPGVPPPARGDPGVIRLDVRGMEPPWPMVRALEALEQLGPAGRLEVLHDRRPLFLYPQLDERGFCHATDEPEPGMVRIAIWRGDSQA
jgi:uncharacterized protein (DUF2249 family)